MRYLTAVLLMGMGLAITTPKTAQSQEILTQENYDEFRDEFLKAETNCWNGSPGSYEKYKALYQRALASGLSSASRYWENGPPELAKRFETDFPRIFSRCPPETQEEALLEERKIDEEERVHRGDYQFIEFFFAKDLYKPPQSGYGVNISNGEKFVGKTDNKLTGEHFEGQLEFSVDDGIAPFDASPWLLKLKYSDLDGSSAAQLQAGSDTVGIVFHDRAPSGSTGLALGANGLDVRTSTSHTDFTARAGIRLHSSSPTKDGFNTNVDFHLGFSTQDTKHTSHITTPAFPDITSNASQDISNDYYFAETQVSVNRYVGSAAIVGFEAAAGIGAVNSGLKSSQVNQCGGCTPSDQMFSINIDDKGSKEYLSLKAGITAKVPLSGGVNATLGGHAYWNSATGYAKNPETGDDLFIRNEPTRLDYDDASGYYVGVGLQASW